MKDDYVKCAVCGRTYKGIVPKGGDGSARRPRMHYVRPIPFINAQVVNMLNNKQYCDGSFQEGIPLH
jgi:hypothetical protein